MNSNFAEEKVYVCSKFFFRSYFNILFYIFAKISKVFQCFHYFYFYFILRLNFKFICLYVSCFVGESFWTQTHPLTFREVPSFFSQHCSAAPFSYPLSWWLFKFRNPWLLQSEVLRVPVIPPHHSAVHHVFFRYSPHRPNPWCPVRLDGVREGYSWIGRGWSGRICLKWC